MRASEWSLTKTKDRCATEGHHYACSSTVYQTTCKVEMVELFEKHLLSMTTNTVKIEKKPGYFKA